MDRSSVPKRKLILTRCAAIRLRTIIKIPYGYHHFYFHPVDHHLHFFIRWIVERKRPREGTQHETFFRILGVHNFRNRIRRRFGSDLAKVVRRCETLNCKRDAPERRKRCHACRRSEWAAKNKVRDKFNKLKANAKRRRIPFTLTIIEWQKFCEETDYHNRCGKKIGDLTIDRINSRRGYSIDNIQVKTLLQNIRKYFDHDRHLPEDWEEQMELQDAELPPPQLLRQTLTTEYYPF